jgi:hypothetical protein
MNGLENDKMGITRKKGKAKRKAFIYLPSQLEAVGSRRFLKLSQDQESSSSFIIINHHHHHQESSSTKLEPTSIVLP